VKTFPAARSYGRAWLVGLGLVMVLLAVPSLLVGVLWSFLIAVVIAVPFLVLAWWFPTIRYTLTSSELGLHYGPFNYTVKLSEIERVSKQNLAISLWSSVRLPGFAMFTVPYSDVGNVFMCATRSAKDIILIVTAERKYGVTPADEDEFLGELRQRLEEI